MKPFIFITCQIGAEQNVKAEVARQFPESRLAFSRPGLLTFKLTESELRKAERFGVQSVFARSWGFSLGTVRGENPAEMASQAWELAKDVPGEENGREIHRVHAFPRDLFKIGDFKFEPQLTAQAEAVCRELCRVCPTPETLREYGQDSPAVRGETVLDCVLVHPEPPEVTAEFRSRRGGEERDKPTQQEWLIGFHRVKSFASTLPGGMLNLSVPEHVVSRAWLKMEEALRWSGFPIKEGDTVCEIGSAPGGATQALLARGCKVLGVDPAEMHPDVLADENFRHLRSKIAFIRRSEFRKVRWLTCDMNVPPNYALEVVESLVTHPEIHIRGMILTLKFTDWEMGLNVDEYLERIHGWNFNFVRARQLHTSHQEICVAAARK